MIGREILLNIVLFIPLGYFCPLYCRVRIIRGSGLSVTISLLVVAAIETVRYIDDLGLCEFDDVFNNVLSACLGVIIYRLCSNCISVNRLSK